MSVLTNPFVSPGRVRVVYRYLLRAKGQCCRRETLWALMSPPALRGEGQSDEMIKAVVSECLEMGLLRDVDGVVEINPTLPEYARRPGEGDRRLPRTIADLVLTGDYPGKEEVGLPVAWYLAQDMADPPRDWNTFESALAAQIGPDKLGLTNNARYGQFRDWFCFLGFGYRYSLRGETSLLPDPTDFIRSALDEILGSPGVRLPIHRFMGDLAARCPVFEGGALREKVEQLLGGRPTNHLSGATTLALLRLQDEGLIKLIAEADAAMYIFQDDELARYSAVERV